MGGFIKVDANKLPTQALNMKINKDIFHDFKVKCKEQGYPINMVIEVFMNQYGNEKYYLSEYNILKWKDNMGETETLNSPINKDIYVKFKNTVKRDKLFIRHVIAAFVEDYAYNDLVMEFSNRKDS